jgi:tetratricopeptide (TPR) repeat protein
MVGDYLAKSVALNGNEARNQTALAQNLVIQAQLGLADGTLDETTASEKINQAVAQGQSALASEPLNPESYDSLILLYQAINTITGQATGALVLDLQQQLSDLEPNHPRHLSDLALSYLSRSQAIQTQSEVNENSENSQTILEQAEADLNLALGLFQQASQLRPQYATATLGVVRVFQLQAREAEAITLADQAAQNFFDDPNALFTLATIFISYEENERAEAALLQAEALLPDDLTIVGSLAQLYDRLDNTNTAIEYYKKVQQIEPLDETAATALQRLVNSGE